MNLPDALAAAVLLFGCWWTGIRIASRYKISPSPLLAVLLAVVVAGLIFHLPRSPLHIQSDGAFYSAWGVSLASDWRNGEFDFQEIWPGKGALPVVIAITELLFGSHMFTVMALSTSATFMTFLVLRICAEKLTPLSGNQWWSTVLFFGSGAFLFFGAAILRESFFWVGGSLATLAIVEASKKRIAQATRALGSGVILMLIVRPDFGFVLGASSIFVALGLVAFRLFKERKRFRSLIVVAILAVLSFLVLPIFKLLQPIPALVEIVAIPRELRNEDVGSRFSISELPEFCNSDSTLAVACQVWANFSQVTFGPSLDQIRDNPTNWVFSLSTLHSFVIISLAFLFWKTHRAYRTLFLALGAVYVVSIIAISGSLTNFGIVWRLKAISIVFLLPAAFVAWDQLPTKLRQKRTEQDRFSQSEI